MPSPNHGKKAYVFITAEKNNGISTNIMSFCTEWSISFPPVNVARAPVLGTDVLAGVEGHGYSARVRVNLLLSNDEPEWDAVFGDESGDENRVEVDFDKAFTQLLAEQEWKTIGKLNIILLSLKDNLKLADASDISKLEGLVGKIYRLTSAAVVGLEETARVGDYVNIRLEVESNRWKKITNKS